jgi:hypothetical protein
MTLQRHQPSIPPLTQDTLTAVTLPDHVDIVIRDDRWRLDLAAREQKHSDLKKGACQGLRQRLSATLGRSFSSCPGVARVENSIAVTN